MELVIVLVLLILSTLVRRKDMDRAYWIPALVAAGTAAYQLYQSSKQKKAAKDLKPSNYVPPGVKEAEISARMDANAQSPAAVRGLERLKQSSANAISAAKRVGGSGAQLQQAVADTDAREKEALKDLQVADAQNQANNRERLRGVLMSKAGYQQQSQDAYNSAKSALLGASAQNQYNAFTNLGEGIVNGLPENAISPTARQPKVATDNTGASSLTKISKGGKTLNSNLSGAGPLTDEQLKQLYKLRGSFPSFKTGYRR